MQRIFSRPFQARAIYAIIYKGEKKTLNAQHKRTVISGALTSYAVLLTAEESLCAAFRIGLSEHIRLSAAIFFRSIFSNRVRFYIPRPALQSIPRASVSTDRFISASAFLPNTLSTYPVEPERSREPNMNPPVFRCKPNPQSDIISPVMSRCTFTRLVPSASPLMTTSFSPPISSSEPSTPIGSAFPRRSQTAALPVFGSYSM